MIRAAILSLFVVLFGMTASAQTSSTDRKISDIMTLLKDNTTGAISPQDLRDAIDSVDSTGWAQYSDTQYLCTGTPFSVAANTDTLLPNNAGAIIDTYKPDDVSTFYDGTAITGRTGDGILITADAIATPTSASTTQLEVWFNIGGLQGEIYRRILDFPKGAGIARPVNFTVAGYTLDTWEQNGARVYIRSNGTFTICNIRYVITRTHRGSSDQ